MIFKSFLLGNLVSLCMKIINSVVVVGLYYGFLTTFSIGPSYLFLLRAHVMEEGTEKKVSATTGFITGQLMMFISIYYAPLHLALSRPHTITVLALPYLLFHFFWNNHKHFFDYGSTTRNSMRNLSIQCVFLNNLIFQLFNHFILPSSMLARLVNIYMFRCNNKMLFVTSSFVGWLIGHILFMKWVGLVLVWIRQNHSIRSNVLIRSNKILVSEFRNSTAQIFSIFLFITCVYYLGRIPSPILTKKLKQTSKTEERDVEIERVSETKGTKQEQEGSTEEDPSPSPFSEKREDPDKIDETEEIRVNGKEKTKDEFDFTEIFYNNSPVYYLYGNQENWKFKILEQNKNKDLLWFEKPLVTLFFDYKRWNRPLRYIKNKQFQGTIRKETSQYFFYTCRSDGKQRISFTYPPSLATFGKMIERKISLFTLEKFSSDELYNNWLYINKCKNANLNNEFINRIEALDTGFLSLGILEKKTRLWNAETKEENDCLVKMYDPLLNGTYRGRMKKLFSSPIINETSIENNKVENNKVEINKIHAILLRDINSREFEYKLEASEKKQGKSDSNKDTRGNFLFNTILTDSNRKQIKNKSIGLNEISKTPLRWSYKLITDLEQQSNKEGVPTDHHIRSRKAKRVVIFTDKNKKGKTDLDTTNRNQKGEIALLRYSQQSDFRRGIIKGSMRAQRRKTVIWELFEANVHSLLFLERIKKSSFDIYELMKIFFINRMVKERKLKILDYTEEKTKRGEKQETYNKEANKKKERIRIEIAETWDSLPFAQVIRGYMLITQAFLRKYIILPSLIISKNIGRMLLLQFPEWSEDLQEWNREMYIKCTYNGIQLSETEFPKNWLTDGIQIKILFPFCLKPWHRSKLRLLDGELMKKKEQKEKDDFCFLTVWGKEAEFPFGTPRKRPSFFEPIFKELEKKIAKLKKKDFLVLRVLKEITKFILKSAKETKEYVIKNVLFLKRLIKELLKVNPILFFISREVYESTKTKKGKDSILSDQIIHNSINQIRSTDWTNYSLTEDKMTNLINRTSAIRQQIEEIEKEQKKVTTKKSPNKKNKKNNVESPPNFLEILKRKNVQLIVKLHYFIKIFIEKIYIDIFLCIINMPRITLQLFIKSTKKILNNYIYTNETNEEKINKTNQNTIDFISNIKKSIYTIRNSKKNSHIFFDLSYLSQAYVFYKLSQIQVSNLYKLKSIFQYNDNGTSFFLKSRIKDFFGRQGIVHSELKHKTLPNFEMNQWKNWLRGHYQYDLSQIRWFRLVPQKWRNRITQFHKFQNKDLKKWDSYEKDRLLDYKKQKNSKVYSLPNKNNNIQKYYRYVLLSYKYINSKTNRDSYIYGSTLEVNNNQEISYNYRAQKDKILKGASIKNYIGKGDIIYVEKNTNRKYFDWNIVNFFIRKKVDIETWIKINPNRNTNIKVGSNKYQIIDKIHNKSLRYLTINSNSEKNLLSHKMSFFDWMGMNQEILNRPIYNLEFLLFPEFVILFNKYKTKPWIIPSKFLLFQFKFNINENISENKNINGKQKGHFFEASKEKQYFELKNQNQDKKEPENERNRGSILPNQQKGKEENYSKSAIKTEKQYKSTAKEELNLLLKRHLLFQLRWDDALNQKMINNIKVYCLLLRLLNPKKISISSIQRGEMSLDIMLIRKDLTLTELLKKGLFIIEPVRLSVKNDGQFFMYQIIRISLVHKSKHQINQTYHELKYVAKNHFDESIPRYERITRNRDKNNYDLLFPEKILSSRRRRELRILISLNLKNSNSLDKNPVFCKENNRGQFWNKSKHFERDKNELEKNELIKLKLFFWPNYRLEDLACMNRYWFDTTNGSRLNMLRISMYP
uniref:Protein TIC 214 n=1 Tax=Nymphoides crenata TaxID=435377 RepID=A0A455LVZ3_9ASTR|nr:Ycf1 [Nymphoides crenata]AZA07095.1 Ycf1 [Nymphoides crenata]